MFLWTVELDPPRNTDKELGPCCVLCIRRALINRHITARSPSPPPSFTQSPCPPRSLVRDGQTSPHRPRLVVSRSTCPPLSPSSLANSLIIGTAVINTNAVNEYHRREPRTNIWPASRMRAVHCRRNASGAHCRGFGFGLLVTCYETSLREMSSWALSALYCVGALLVINEGSEV